MSRTLLNLKETQRNMDDTSTIKDIHSFELDGYTISLKFNGTKSMQDCMEAIIKTHNDLNL